MDLCLILTWRQSPPKNLPTLVWIYGGGYTSGEAAGYNREDIIRQSNEGIVVVVIRYRLGLFRFLAGSEVKKDGDLNAGLYFALRWVNKYSWRGSLLLNAPRYEGKVNEDAFPEHLYYGRELFAGTLPQLWPSSGACGWCFVGLGTDQLQVNAVYGEAILICPTNAFRGRAFKGKFAIPPALHSMDLTYYFPSRSVPPFNNTAFINAFAQLFTSFIISLEPNIKVDPTTITPQWNKFDIGDTEMLFNQTAVDGLPVVQPIETSILEQCREPYRQDKSSQIYRLYHAIGALSLIPLLVEFKCCDIIVFYV
ncbi:Alpha/Beta hydrolase protein [Mycena alexandri]|uniref:Alpha/Beta hydrolase protein n=1 Tax=Mycena alexandri TaxID=1745969 RepID=A0AAD6SJ45_9AGAR|nr:Alpha/Beta hydrolase protein [Mycena alexandri]